MHNHLKTQFSVFTFITILLITATALAWFYVKPYQASKNALQTALPISEAQGLIETHDLTEWDGNGLYALQQTIASF